MVSSPGTHLPYHPTKSMALGRPVNSISSTCSPCSAGQLLFDLGHCIDDKQVQAKGAQQSICCTKSYHGLRDFARVHEALQRLVYALWPRLLEVSPVQPTSCCADTSSTATTFKFTAFRNSKEVEAGAVSLNLPFLENAAMQNLFLMECLHTLNHRD